MSIAYIILGAFMTVCGAIQSMLQLKYLLLDSLYGGVWVGLWVSIVYLLATARFLLS